MKDGDPKRQPRMDLLKPRVSRFAGVAIVAAILSSISMAQPNASQPEIIKSAKAPHDAALNLSPQSPFWRDGSPIFFEDDNYGRPVKPLRTEVRSRWTDSSLYLLFICPYEDLNLHPSPQTEWLDLDIDLDLDQRHRDDAWKWNSGFETAARIDPEKKIWYGVMRI